MTSSAFRRGVRGGGRTDEGGIISITTFSTTEDSQGKYATFFPRNVINGTLAHLFLPWLATGVANANAEDDALPHEAGEREICF